VRTRDCHGVISVVAVARDLRLNLLVGLVTLNLFEIIISLLCYTHDFLNAEVRPVSRQPLSRQNFASIGEKKNRRQIIRLNETESTIFENPE